jgi:hypothetical protein
MLASAAAVLRLLLIIVGPFGSVLRWIGEIAGNHRILNKCVRTTSLGCHYVRNTCAHNLLLSVICFSRRQVLAHAI